MKEILPYLFGILGGGGFLAILFWIVTTNAKNKVLMKQKDIVIDAYEKQKTQVRKDVEKIAAMSDDDIDDLLSR